VRKFSPATVNHTFHFLWSLITGGLWLIGWIAHCLGRALRPLRCADCGWHNPEFRMHADESGFTHKNDFAKASRSLTPQA